MILVGLTGLKRSGKDTVADRLVSRHGFVKVAYADPLRDMALALDPMIEEDATHQPYRLSEAVTDLGWEEAKTYPEVRRTLQRLGTEVIRNHVDRDFWIDKMHTRIKDLRINGFERIAITDCRFPNEASLVRANGGTMVKVVRDGIVADDDHASENVEALAPFHFVLQNNHAIDNLHVLTDTLAGVLIERKTA